MAMPMCAFADGDGNADGDVSYNFRFLYLIAFLTISPVNLKMIAKILPKIFMPAILLALKFSCNNFFNGNWALTPPSLKFDNGSGI